MPLQTETYTDSNVEGLPSPDVGPSQGYRIFIDDGVGSEPALPAGFRTTDRPDAADILLVASIGNGSHSPLPSADPLRPVIVVGADANARELAATDLRTATLEAALDDAAAIADRVRALRQTVDIDDTRASAAYLLAFAWTRAGRIDARFSPRLARGFGYDVALPLGAAPDDPAVDPVVDLAALAAIGYLAEELRDVAHACPACGAIHVLLRDGCPECRSVDVRDESLIHHFACGFQGEESLFGHRDGVHVCPKCRRDLRHFGLDYDKPGIVHRCNACGHQASELRAVGRCLNCDRRFAAEDSARLHIFDYVLTPAGTDALFGGDLQADPAGQLIGHQLPLLPQRFLAVMLGKLEAIASRHALDTLVVTIDLNRIQKLPQGAGMQLQLFVRIGTELARLVRATDVVSYHLGKLTLLLPGAHEERTQAVEQRFRAAMATIFDDGLVEQTEFSCLSVANYLRIARTEAA